jgi:DNA-directed RNA polymerase alpha subunit
MVQGEAEGEGQMSELEPTPELLDNMPIREVRFPTRIKDTLFAAGLKTVGEVREISDEALLSLPDFGKASVAHLRERRADHEHIRRGRAVHNLQTHFFGSAVAVILNSMH